MSVSDWSDNPGDNTKPPPKGAPDGMAVKAISETLRYVMASAAKWYRDPDWVDYGHAGVWQSPRVFKVLGDHTDKYTPFRAIRFNGDTLPSYDYINFSEWRPSSQETFVTVLGALPVSIQRIALGVPTKDSMPMNWMDRAIPAEGFIYKPKQGEAYATTEVYLKKEVDEKFLKLDDVPGVITNANGDTLTAIVNNSVNKALLSSDNFPYVVTPASSYVRLPPNVWLMFGSILVAPWALVDLNPEGPARELLATFCNPSPACSISITQTRHVAIKNNTARRVQCSWLALGV
jgi:hypothetical protein